MFQVLGLVLINGKIFEIRGSIIVVIEVDVMDLQSSLCFWFLTKLLRHELMN